MDVESVQRTMQMLRQQHKVISKKVLQNILEQRNPCNNEIHLVQDTDVLLQESLLECKKARSYLSCAKKNLTTTSLHILAMYKKRERMHDLLHTMHKLKKLKATELQIHKLLDLKNYAQAIALLLECERLAADNGQYACVTALSRKLQNTLMTVELQLDDALARVPHTFDAKQYTNLQDAYRLLAKSVAAVDQLHINFISAIHTMAYNVLKEFRVGDADDRQKYLYEEMCASISADNFIPCLIKLCKSFWCILVCYYQAALWHHNARPLKAVDAADSDPEHADYIQQKFKCGYNRIWSDIQSKLSLYLSTNRTMHTLKYEQFIQVLSVVQRLRKVGMEFCSEPSTQLMESMRSQCVQFFQRYHKSCLDEIRLFLDNEAWMPVHSFNDLLQLQEFGAVKGSMERFMRKDAALRQRSDGSRASPTKRPLERKKSLDNQLNDENLSNHSQEDCSSSVYGSCGYFLRFSEKSSPFDGGFDKAMLEEDILAGIADESSCYFSEESEEEPNADVQALDDDSGVPRDGESDAVANSSPASTVIVNNSSLNVLRCIGRYLQMCKLLHSIAPQIVKSMTELIEFYVFVVHEFFAHDLPLASENLYSNSLRDYLRRVSYEVVAKVDNWKSDVTNVSVFFWICIELIVLFRRFLLEFFSVLFF